MEHAFPWVEHPVGLSGLRGGFPWKSPPPEPFYTMLLQVKEDVDVEVLFRVSIPFATAILVFLSAAAGTGVVAAYLALCPRLVNHLLDPLRVISAPPHVWPEYNFRRFVTNHDQIIRAKPLELPSGCVVQVV